MKLDKGEKRRSFAVQYDQKRKLPLRQHFRLVSIHINIMQVKLCIDWVL